MKYAKWIWAHKEDNPDEYVRFYTDFCWNGKSISIDLSCDSNYELYINGTLAGFGQYSDLPTQKTYDRIDITEFYRLGKNQIVILVWYYGKSFFTYQKGTPGLIFEVTEDNTVVAFSDQNTLCSKAQDYVSGLQKIITQQLGFSYTYDMRAYDGYRTNDFTPKTNDWVFSTEITNPTVSLQPRPIQKLSVKPFVEGVLIDRTCLIYDLGEETVGYLSFSLKAPSGAHINISYGEHLVKGEMDNLEVPRKMASRDFSMDFIANGEWFCFSNYLRRLGCRYLQISCESEIEVERIGLYPVEYPVRVIPFETSSPLRRKIYEVCVHTLRCCMFEHYEDCPWREQALYTLDSRNQMLCGYYAFEEYEFAKASLQMFGDDWREDGLLHICVPSDADLVIPFFSLFYIVQMKEYAEHSKDFSLIHAYADKMNGILRAFITREEDGLIPNFYGDRRYWNFYEWIPELQGSGGRNEGKSFDLVLNAMVSWALQNMSDMMIMVEKKHEAEKYQQQAKRYNEAINRFFYCQKDGLYRVSLDKDVYVELGNVLAILCGAATGRVAENICEQIEIGKRLVPTTLSMKALKYDALLKVSQEKYEKYILCEIDQNYSYMLNCGATSFWETLKGAADFGGAGSLCHGWSAIPIVYYNKLNSHMK
jgi:hypothetical protein